MHPPNRSRFAPRTRALARRTLTALSVLGLVVPALATTDAAFAAATVQVAPVAPSDSPATIIARAAETVPSPRQLAWQLFPSKYSNFGVASSSWSAGRGDVVKSFTDSMHRYGLKAGLYVSPADLHENLSGGKFATAAPPGR